MEDFYKEYIIFPSDFRDDNELSTAILLLADKLKANIVRVNRGNGYEIELEGY